MSQIASSLRRVGPRPVLLTRYVAHQGAQRLVSRRLRRRYATLVSARSAARLRTWPLDLPRREQLPQELTSPAADLIAEADQVLEGRVDILGSGPSQVGPDIDWHRDFKSGYRWPDIFFMDLTVSRLDDDSDAKVPWELSRSHHLLTLARAARLTGIERYAHEVGRQLSAWLDANPPGIGINWSQPMEIALRAVNWVWILRTLEPAFSLPRELHQRVISSLQSHGRHVSMTLEGTPYLRSNHYLSNILGLIVLGAVLDGDSRAPGWLDFARRAFEREILKQVLDDGMSFEASVGYHALVSEIFLLGRLVSDWCDVPMSPSFDARLTAMLMASRALRHPHGHVPLFGDVDSGRVLPGSFARPGSHDSILGLGAAILNADRLVDGSPSPEVAWTLGVDRWAGLAARGVEQSRTPDALRDGGIYVLHRRELRAVVRCGGVGQNGNGGHAHNDTGSYELCCGTTPLVVDPGTYVYTADPDSRNAFRSTAAHSTLMIDGAEINPIARNELFRLPQFAHPTVLDWHSEATAMLRLEHDGYRRLPGSPRHERAFELAHDGSALTVVDRVTGEGFHRLECLVHLAPEVDPEPIDLHTFSLPGGGHTRVTLRFAGPGVVVDVRDGWVAPQYGVRLPAKVVAAQWAGQLPARIEHRFLVTEP